MDYKIDIEKLFDKKFTFNRDTLTGFDCLDGYFAEPLWEFAIGSQFQQDLDLTRGELDDKDLISWGGHTSRTDLASFIMPEIRRCVPNISSELFTRAWCKITEIIMSFPVLKLDNPTTHCNEVNGLFLCEAPGSFVNAVNYFIQSEKPGLTFNWTASSLNPYYEEMDIIKTTIGDDRLIKCVNIYKHWFFGYDNRGDLLDSNFLRQICDIYKNKKADLVTGDGGINCIDEPDKQEAISFPLIFHQFLTAINCLKPGGSFVLKIFTLFTSQTLSLLFLINNLFNEVSCFKPISSKSGNSEVYLICIDFRDGNQNLINQLTNRYFELSEKNPLILSELALLDQSSISSSFIRQFIDCSRLFKDYQKSAIIQNLSIYNDPRREKIYAKLNGIKKAVARAYLGRYPIRKVPSQSQIAFGYDLNSKELNLFKFRSFSLIDSVTSHESYKKRKMNGKISFEKMFSILQNLYDREESEPFFHCWFTLDPADISKVKFTYGRKFEHLSNSRFVNKYLMQLYNMVTESGCRNIFTKDQIVSYKAENRFDSLITFCLSNGVEFNHIFGPKSSAIALLIISKFPQLQAKIFEKEDMEGTDSTNKKSNFFIIDPYWNHLKLLINGDSLNSSAVSFVLRESDVILDIITQLIDYITYAKSNDVLILHATSSLSRLMVGIIYLVTSFFTELACIPSYTQKISQTTFQLGMLFLFTNKNSTIRDADTLLSTKQHISSILNQIKDVCAIGRPENALLEIFSIPEILLNEKFCRLISTGNFVHLSEKMEFIVV